MCGRQFAEEEEEEEGEEEGLIRGEQKVTVHLCNKGKISIHQALMWYT
jgi:hypothetical protein